MVAPPVVAHQTVLEVAPGQEGQEIGRRDLQARPSDGLEGDDEDRIDDEAAPVSGTKQAEELAEHGVQFIETKLAVA